LFDAFRAVSRPAFIEIESSDTLLFALACTYARNLATESVVFHDHATTDLPANGAVLRCKTGRDEIARAIQERQGGPEFELELSGSIVAKGGFLFHYNRPYCDIYMEVSEGHRRRGFGAFLVQELKREAYALGAIPCARCNPGNVASRRTLQRAGFVPFAHILNGTLDRAQS
jgi:GNAT superfamily N-acetyltransferase